MSDTPFHQTRMGHAFFEGAMPGLVRELARLNANLERLLAVTEGEEKRSAPATSGDADPGEGR